MPQKKTDQELLTALETRKSQIEARIQDKRAAIRSKQRKQDTKRKIIAGALALEHAECYADHDPEFAATLWWLISRYVKRPADRALFDIE